MKKERRKTSDLSGVFASVYVALIAAVYPLYFNNQFFDINRSKMTFFTYATGIAICACVLLRLSAFMWAKHKKISLYVQLPIRRRISVSDVGIVLFVLSAGIACALSPYGSEAWTGDAGRKAGFRFILMLFLMYVCISRFFRFRHGTLWVYLAAGVLVAGLGILNFYKIDPLGFYKGMKKDQVIIFMSTIGNINFLGFYLCMVLPFAASGFIHQKRRSVRLLCAAAAMVCFYASVTARTDGAFLGIAIMFLLLFYFSFNSSKTLYHTFILLFLYFLAIYIVRFVGVMSNWYGYAFQGGLCERIVKSKLSLYVMIGAAILCALSGYYAHMDGSINTALFKRTMLMIVFGCAVGLLLAIMYFTFVNPDVEVGTLASFLRLNDSWGTYRGFAWSRSLQAYGELPIIQKIVGVGPDTMRRVLTPFRDAQIEAAAHGQFENCHNEYLQYLLTTGIMGLIGFITFIAGSIMDAYKHRADTGAFTFLISLGVYAVLCAVNVNQPVTVVQLFFIAAMQRSFSYTQAIRSQRELSTASSMVDREERGGIA